MRQQGKPAIFIKFSGLHRTPFRLEHDSRLNTYIFEGKAETFVSDVFLFT